MNVFVIKFLWSIVFEKINIVYYYDTSIRKKHFKHLQFVEQYNFIVFNLP